MDATKQGFRVGEFVDELSRAYPIGRSAFYSLPKTQRPRSVRLGRSTIIIETPAEFIARLAREQQVSAGQFTVVDFRATGELRLVAATLDPREANAALEALVGAGDDAEVVVVPALDPVDRGAA